MPNLVGVWNPDFPEERIHGALANQLRRVRVPGTDYAESVVSFPGFGVALQDHGILENGPQPAVSGDKQVMLLIDGELNNATELRQQFLRDLPSDTPIGTPDVCLRLIFEHGPEVAVRFDGFFCIVCYDHRHKRVTMISDRYGARPLFYVRRGEAVLFGTELKALAAVDPAPRRLDEIGVLELFCYGTHFMDRTWMEGYVRLPPASILTIDPTGLRISRYWIYGYDESAKPLDQATYATVFGILLDRAVERRMAGTKRIGIFLSGGYDSRSVAAAIRKHRRPVPAFTFGLAESRDVRYATILAHRLGLEHHVSTGHGRYLFANCRQIVWRTEGMLSFANVTSIALHPTLKEKMDIILTGLLGEFSGSHSWPRLLLTRSRKAVVSAIFNRFVRTRIATAQRIFERGFFSRVYEGLRERFYGSFDVIRNERPLDIADSWNFLHLQPRGTFQAPAVDRHKFEMRAPHTDIDLLDFLLTIPPHARLEQRVYKKMIAHSFPDIRDVPCTNSARAIEPNFGMEYALMVGRYLARNARMTRFLRHPSLGREFRSLDDDFRAEPELIDLILKPLLTSDVLPDSVFNHAGIADIVREHRESKIGHEGVLGLLISIGLALKYFLHDDFADVPESIYAPR
jgi:asparagine synthetase B (glutamine-hydrolysing)